MAYIDMEREVRLASSRRADPRGDADALEAAVCLVVAWQAEEIAAKRPWSSPRSYLIGLGMTRQAASHVVGLARERWRLDREAAADLIERACLDGLATCDGPVIGSLPGEHAGQGHLRDAAGNLIMERDHKGRLGYMRELARLHGTDAPTKQETKVDASDDLKAMLAKSRNPNPPQILPDLL